MSGRLTVQMGVETTTTRAREDGFSLVELIVVMTMLTVALGSILTLVERTTRISNEDRERAHAIRSAQVELSALVREGRQAFRVNPSNPTRLDISTTRGGATKRVIYDCTTTHPTLPSSKRCMRQEMLPDGSLTTAQVAIDRVRNPSIFTYTPASGVVDHIAVTIEVPASGELRSGGRTSLIRLHDGFAVRNRGIVP